MLLLDALSAAGEGAALVLLFKALLLVVFPIGLCIYLLMRAWGKHIEQQFDREPKEGKSAGQMPARQLRGASFFLWLMVAMMLASFVVLGAWIY